MYKIGSPILGDCKDNCIIAASENWKTASNELVREGRARASEAKQISQIV